MNGRQRDDGAPFFFFRIHIYLYSICEKARARYNIYIYIYTFAVAFFLFFTPIAFERAQHGISAKSACWDSAGSRWDAW